MSQRIHARLNFFTRCRAVLQRRLTIQQSVPITYERLEPRLAPAITSTVGGTPTDPIVEVKGDAADNNFGFGVSPGSNLTHNFPLTPGGGAGTFNSNEDFDSTQPGDQKVP